MLEFSVCLLLALCNGCMFISCAFVMALIDLSLWVGAGTFSLAREQRIEAGLSSFVNVFSPIFLWEVLSAVFNVAAW